MFKRESENFVIEDANPDDAAATWWPPTICIPHAVLEGTMLPFLISCQYVHFFCYKIFKNNHVKVANIITSLEYIVDQWWDCPLTTSPTWKLASFYLFLSPISTFSTLVGETPRLRSRFSPLAKFHQKTDTWVYIQVWIERKLYKL